MSISKITPKKQLAADKFLFIAALALLAVLGGAILAGRKAAGLPIIGSRKTLEFVHYWDGAKVDSALARIARGFERENPEFRVIIKKGALEDIREMITEDAPPALIALDPAKLLDFDAESYLEKLPSEGDAVDEKETAAYYRMLTSFFHPLFYNTEILEKAGYSRPPKTRAEFLAYARAIKEAYSDEGADKGVFPLALSRDIFSETLPWFMQSDAANFSWTSLASIDTLRFFSTLYKEELLYTLPLARREDELLDAFMRGKVAFFVSSMRSAQLIREAAPELSFDVTAIPGGAQGGKGVFAVTGWAVGAPSKSRYKNEALLLLDYLAERRDEISAAAYGIKAGGVQEGDEEAVTDGGADSVASKLKALFASASFITKGVDIAEEALPQAVEAFLSLFQGGMTEAETAKELDGVFKAEKK